MFFVHAVERHRAIGPAAFHHRRGGGAPLGVDQLGQRLAGERIERREANVRVRNLARRVEALDGPEGEHLVVRPFNVQLHLRMLVGRAQGGHRRLPGMHGLALAVLRLAQRFRPQLPEPEGGAPQMIRVRKGHLDGLVLARPDQPVIERGPQCDILRQVGLPAVGGDARGAAAELRDIDADQRGRHQSHRRQHAEAATHVFGNAENLIALGPRQFVQIALAFGGDSDDASGRGAQRLLEPLAHDQKRRHRLGRAAGFGDDDHQRLLRVHRAKRGGGKIRVHVVEDHQPRVLRGESALDGMRPANAAIERPRSQRAATNADHAHRVVAAAHFGGVAADRPNDFGLKRQVRETEQPRFALLAEACQRFLRFGLRALHLGAGYAVGFAHHFGQQVRLVKLNVHEWRSGIRMSA